MFCILDYNAKFPCGGEDWTRPFWNGKGNIFKLFNNIYLYLCVLWMVMLAVYGLTTNSLNEKEMKITSLKNQIQKVYLKYDCPPVFCVCRSKLITQVTSRTLRVWWPSLKLTAPRSHL